MTRVSDQGERRETAESVPVQPFSAICPMSHFFFVEIEQRVRGSPAPRGTMGKEAEVARYGTPRWCW